MAKLRNTHRLFDLAIGESVTVGNNRTMHRVKYGNRGEFAFKGRLHGHGIFFASVAPSGQLIRVSINDCGFLTRTTADAVSDFARALGGDMSASIAGGTLSLRFRNGAGHWVDRPDLESDVCHGPYALSRWHA